MKQVTLAGGRAGVLSMSAVLRRGWTRSMVQQVLGEPDGTKPNPYGRGPPVQLYRSERVEAAEASPRFHRLALKAAPRRAAAAKTVETRRARLLAWVDGLRIRVPKVSDVQSRAIQHYNALWADRGRFEKHADASSGESFLQRITVNYLRHEVTQYEEALAATWGQTGVHEAAPRLRHRVLDAIAKAYPELAAECARQASGGR